MSAPHSVDLKFQGLPGVISSFVLESDDGPVVVDPGPSSALGTLRSGLQELGFALEDVRHVLLTHIHLDHAGAAGTICAESGATVYVHAHGARHLARPERLIASATQIYGDAMDTLWGQMRPVPEDKLRVIAGDEQVEVGGRVFEAFYSPGHAIHHVAWRTGHDLFCGDVAGIRLEAAQTPRAPTPPPDIDLEAWRTSIARLRALDVRKLHLAHFGSHDDPQSHWDGLLRTMDLDATRVREALERGVEGEDLVEEFTRAQLVDMAGEGADVSDRLRFASPAWMSVQGLVRYWRRKARA